MPSNWVDSGFRFIHDSRIREVCFGESQSDLHRTDGYSSRIRPFIIIGLVRFTRWTVIEFSCLPNGDIEYAGAGDGHEIGLVDVR